MIRLKELREEYGLSQKELALKLNTTQRNISNWETGKFSPDIEMLIAISQLFNENIDYIVNNNFAETNDNVILSTIDKKLIKIIHEMDLEKKKALLSFLEK